LAGLEKALAVETEAEVELAIRRIALLHGVIFTIGGIPLLYLGDEVATLNDYGYIHDADKARDSRWVHRPLTDWQRMARRQDPSTVEGRVYGRLSHLIAMRRSHEAFWGSSLQVVDTQNDSVLGYVRQHGKERVLVLANFSEESQIVVANQLRLYGLAGDSMDLISGQVMPAGDATLEPYALLCLRH
jgi:amylosucrase